MSKKKKCIDCKQSMRWALPDEVSNQNLDYARRRIFHAKHTLVCGHTMITKPLNNEQYCNHFIPKSELDIKANETYEKEVKKLEQMIIEFEQGLEQ